jgi:hypothetical protein
VLEPAERMLSNMQPVAGALTTEVYRVLSNL